MQMCLQEWESGFYRPHDLHFPTQRPIYDSHLAGLRKYERAAAKRLHDFRNQWFDLGM
jgi:hypothetical protein